MRNAAERRAFPHYIGTLKDLTGRHPKQLPMRSYFASCNVDGSERQKGGLKDRKLKQGWFCLIKRD